VKKAMGDKYKIQQMDLDLAKQIADSFADWLPKLRLEFAMCGEPLLHEHVPEIIAYYREKLPKFQLTITSNSDPIRVGLHLKIDKIKELFEDGLNTLMLDCYGADGCNGDWQYKQYAEQLTQAGIPWQDYYSKFMGATSVYSYHGYKHHNVILTPDLGVSSGVHKSREICNHCGNVDPILGAKYGAKVIIEPLMKRCTKPFRELSIKTSGVVAGCCIDHCMELVMGKFPEESLKDIWFGRRFNLLRQLLYNKDRGVIPCSKCDYFGGFRTGILNNPQINLSNEAIKQELEQTNTFQQFNLKVPK
jgi:MoaA/NifB/PqqE/SkfB family radical SAM enzyme